MAAAALDQGRSVAAGSHTDIKNPQAAALRKTLEPGRLDKLFARFR